MESHGPPTVKESSNRQDFDSRLHNLADTRSPLSRLRAIASIADDLDLAEVREALAETERLAMRDCDKIRLQLLSRWAELEPEAALLYARKLPGGTAAPKAIEAVVNSWYGVNPAAAERAVEELEGGFAKRVALGALVGSIAANDPRRAFSLLQKGTPSAESVISVFTQWSAINPEEAATHAGLLPSGLVRDLALSEATKAFTEKDREGALTWAQELPDTDVPGGSIERREPAPLASVLKSWMNEDTGAAMKWIQELPEGVEKADVLAALSRALAESDPHRAVEVAALMPPGKAQDSVLGKLMRSWADKDFSGALQWAREQDADVQDVLLPQLANRLMLRDTAAALDLALSLGGKPGQRAVGDVLGFWTRKEPANAAAWAEVQPDNENLLRRVAFQWAGADENTAREWVGTLPPGATKDATLLSGVRCIVQGNQPQTAVPWIEQMSDAARREDAYWELGYAWLRFNPKDARAWLKDAPLSAKSKAELLQPKAR